MPRAAATTRALSFVARSARMRASNARSASRCWRRCRLQMGVEVVWTSKNSATPLLVAAEIWVSHLASRHQLPMML